MKPHVSLRPSSQFASIHELKCYHAFDLTADPARRALWRTDLPGVRDAEEAAGEGLPRQGVASPMGYWLAPLEPGTAPAQDALALSFAAPGDEGGQHVASLGNSQKPGWGRPIQTVRLKAPGSGDGDLTLTVGPAGARISASPTTWKVLAEPVLLAICQYWRFAAIDAEIGRLTQLARGDMDHSNMPGIGSLRAHGVLVQRARDVRALLLDLPHFEGPLTDPLPYCSSEQAAKAYETLAEKLDLEDWCELIDERAEAVEDAYEALTEKLFEFKNFAWEAVLEGLIIVILLAELGVALYEAFAP
jgi:hypothetical protein